jgi:predicted regulator of Ras-like GTPase activity (Roadblock/LC7/MglB family)
MKENRGQLQQKIAQLETELAQHRVKATPLGAVTSSSSSEEQRELEAGFSAALTPHYGQREHKDLLLKVKLLDAQVTDLENLRGEYRRVSQENALLKNLARESETLRRQLENLRDENLRLNQLKLDTKLFSREKSTLALELKDQRLQELLTKLNASKQTRGAAFADERGLVIVGCGTLNDEIAAVSALLAGLAEKTAEALVLSKIRRISVTDDQEQKLVVQPCSSNDFGKAFLGILIAGRESKRLRAEQGGSPSWLDLTPRR